MKKLLYLLTIFIAIFLLHTTNTVAYSPYNLPNNIYGISIVNHSDIYDASKLINSNGGDWGYVTIVITENDRNKILWQSFLDNCRQLHIIPIIRIATKYEDDNWKIPKIEDIDSWINFFNSLNWVTENRYIIIGNEPNHSKEWGGKINPSQYASYLKTFAERLHNANKDYFVLNAGLDQDAPNSKYTMDEKKYIELMLKEVPDIFNFIDGFASHSYPNPAFSGPKDGQGRRSIKGYEWELSLIKKDLPVFITETGWVRHNNMNEKDIALNMKYAFENVWSRDTKVVAVTPFVLNYQNDPFYEFSWKTKDGSYFTVYNHVQDIQKIRGVPKQKISGEVIFNFLNPLMIRNTEQKGYSLVKNTGQAIWTQSDSNFINESKNEIKVSNTKFNSIPPFTTGLVTYTLKSPNIPNVFDVKLGFYVGGEKIGNTVNGKIISF